MALFAGICIAGILGCVAALFVVTDRSLGAMEAVTLVVLVGLSVDYSLHYGHAYHHAPAATRANRARHAMQVMGSSIISSAITTGGASAFLLLASITVCVWQAAPRRWHTHFDLWAWLWLWLWVCCGQILSTVGVVMCVMIVCSVVFTLLLFVSLMSTFGPERGSGCCDGCNCYCRRCTRCWEACCCPLCLSRAARRRKALRGEVAGATGTATS